MNRPRREPLRVCLLGLGSVGAEVARGLLERPAALAAGAAGRPIELVAVGVRQPGRVRAIELPSSVRRTDDLAALAADPTIDILVELLGGLDPAADLVTGALAAGRSVVTANKALLAERGAELETLGRERGAALRFEAAVGGGLPILGPLAADLAANRWSRVRGVVNGTTNLLLERMAQTGQPLEACLAEARGQGILEADAADDVEGFDAARKLAILIRLCFGAWPDVAAIPRGGDEAGSGIRSATPGVAGVTPEAIAAAARVGRVLKLVAEARRGTDGTIAAEVGLVALPAEEPLARVRGTDNRIELEGEPLGTVAFEGPGAGGRATSSAVLGDLLALARGEGSTWAGLPAAGRLAAEGVARLPADADADAASARAPSLEAVG
ncbi:MAG TPA: homoserine dehydrogenase [Candidatus Limnocylindrales bacterium]|nr:homoserine dehydrogenase [Candidatus Limnocylindrales bacterium]